MKQDYQSTVMELSNSPNLFHYVHFKLELRLRRLVVFATCQLPEFTKKFHDKETAKNKLRLIKNYADNPEYEELISGFKKTKHASAQDAILSNAVYNSGHFLNLSTRIKEKQIRLIASMVDPGWNFNARWRTDNAVALANQMYNTEDFSAMPILADAITDADCDETELLARMRDPKSLWCCGSRIIDKILQKR